MSKAGGKAKADVKTVDMGSAKMSDDSSAAVDPAIFAKLGFAPKAVETEAPFTCSKADLNIIMEQLSVSQERAIDLLQASNGSVLETLRSYIRGDSKALR